MSTIHRENVDPDARVLIRGFKDRHIMWIGSGQGGMEVQDTILRADVFEVPRVPLFLLGDETIEHYIDRVLPDGYEARFVHWPELDAPHAQFPEAFGLAMIAPKGQSK